MKRIDTTLGELITIFYDEFLRTYGDEELATMCTWVMVDRLVQGVGA